MVERFAYDLASGKLLSRTDPLGNRWDMSYTARGQLSRPSESFIAVARGKRSARGSQRQSQSGNSALHTSAPSAGIFRPESFWMGTQT
ncbi:MAG: hypothetical protein ACK6DF_02900, partial [Betaproteobacteria bacterium]